MRNTTKTIGNQKSNSLNDLLFPVEIVECTDYLCNRDYQFDIFVYPFKTFVEAPKNQMIDMPEILAICESTESAKNQEIELIDSVETVEAVELIEVPDFSKKIRVNCCSERYELVPNSEIFPAIEQVLNMNQIAFTANYQMINYARFYVEYIIEDSRFAYPVAKGDYVKPIIKVQHSYNGLTKYSISVGYFRFICSNGLVIAVEDMKQFNLNIAGKHTQSITNSLNQLENALKMFENDSTVLQTIVSKYQLLNSVPVADLKKSIETTLEKVGVRIVSNKSLNTVDNIYNRITKELQNPILEWDGTATNWHLYNGINAYINDNTLNIAVPEIRATNDQNVFEYLLDQSKKYFTPEPIAELA